MKIRLIFLWMFVHFVVFGQEEGLESFKGNQIGVAKSSFSTTGGIPDETSQYLEIKDFHYNMVKHLPQPVWENHFILNGVDNRVTLRYDDTENYKFKGSWKLQVDYSLYTNIGDGFGLPINGQLEIVYNNDNDPSWDEHQDISSRVIEFPSNPSPLHKGLNPRVYITDIHFSGNQPGGGTSDKDYLLTGGCDDLFLDLELHVDKQYTVQANDILDLHIENASSFGLSNPSQDFVELAWNYTEGAEQFELDWLFIDLGKHNVGTSGNSLTDYPNYTYDFKNATRIQLSKNNYKIPLAYTKGLLAFRSKSNRA